jgi:hypothetical protein
MPDMIPNDPAPNGDIPLYQTEDERTRLETHVHEKTVSLSLNQMAERFQRDAKGAVSALKREIDDLLYEFHGVTPEENELLEEQSQ